MYEILGMTEKDWEEAAKQNFSKGPWHGKAMFSHLYNEGNNSFRESRILKGSNLNLSELEKAFPLHLANPYQIVQDYFSRKFILKFSDGSLCESVIIKMQGHETLCVSSQIGCRMGCTFCETGSMGLKRNLTSGEIIAQLMTARFILKSPFNHIVFMGMGEPADNLTAVLKSIEIMSNPHGLNLFCKNITISTSGNTDAIDFLANLAILKTGNLHKIKLAVSLNAAIDKKRSEIMPVNRSYPLNKLKKSLMDYPVNYNKARIILEYIHLSGFNDRKEDIEALIKFTEGLSIMINLIPYNAGSRPLFKVPDKKETNRFFERMIEAGLYVRKRGSRGEKLMAACGQLGKTKNSSSTIHN